jgi:hypothetical protein
MWSKVIGKPFEKEGEGYHPSGFGSSYLEIALGPHLNFIQIFSHLKVSLADHIIQTVILQCNFIVIIGFIERNFTLWCAMYIVFTDGKWIWLYQVSIMIHVVLQHLFYPNFRVESWDLKIIIVLVPM